MPQYRMSEIADLFGVSDDTVRRWAESGQLTAVRDASEFGRVCRWLPRRTGQASVGLCPCIRIDLRSLLARSGRFLFATYHPEN